MDVQAVVFDVNGTLIDIWTEDGRDEIFRSAGHFLTYQGIHLRRHQVRDLYFDLMKQQQRASAEEHPEYDATAIWRQIIGDHASDFTRSLPAAKLEWMPLFLAEMSRGISRRRLQLFPDVLETLDLLRAHFPLALVTDAQSAWARGELNRVGLLDYFDPIVVSGDHGFRKPDPRLFQLALDALDVAAEHAVYIGNDMHRDVYGAQQLGMQTVMFDSEHGSKDHLGTVPDHRITEYRDLPALLGLSSAIS